MADIDEEVLEDIANLNISTLVSLNDFEECFAHACRYDVTEPPWPRRTILIYKLGNNWTRLDNIPGRHAELVLIDQIQTELNTRNADTDPVETVNIEVYISYSPCRNCSNELIQIFGAYQKSFNLVFKIYYSNLYLYPQERDGLVNLLNRGVDLQPVIGEDMWKDFLLANGNPNDESFLAVVNSDGRIQRETRDQELFAEIQALTQL